MSTPMLMMSMGTRSIRLSHMACLSPELPAPATMTRLYYKFETAIRANRDAFAALSNYLVKHCAAHGVLD
jgi:hypothetical protein